MTGYIPPPPRQALSEDGRRVLAEAVTVDHDWNLPHSGVDELIKALGALSDADLEVAYLIAHHVTEAVACVQIRRDMARDAAKRDGAR